MKFCYKRSDYKQTTFITIIQIVLLILIIGGVELLLTRDTWVPKVVEYILRSETPIEVPASDRVEEQKATIPFDGKKATFSIDDVLVTLVDGESTVPAVPGAASMVTTQYFGNGAEGDLTGDGRVDTVFIVTQNTGGSGTFFYVIGAISIGDSYKTTNAVLVGDRISPQSTQIPSGSGEVLVNYVDRKEGEAMTAVPSVGKTMRLIVTPAGVLEEVKK